MSRDCPDRRPNKNHQNSQFRPPQGTTTGTVTDAAMVDMEDVYPERCSPADRREGGSGEIGIEINANMVETFDGWISKEQTVRQEQTVERELQLVRKNSDELVAARDDRSRSPKHSDLKQSEYQQRSWTPDWVGRRGRSREPTMMMRRAQGDRSPVRAQIPLRNQAYEHPLQDQAHDLSNVQNQQQDRIDQQNRRQDRSEEQNQRQDQIEA